MSKIHKLENGTEYVEHEGIVRFFRNIPDKAGMQSFEVVVNETILTDGVLNHRKDWVEWAWKDAED